MNRIQAVLALLLLGSHLSFAADVQISVSSNEAYVDFPVTVQIRIDNASKYEQPKIEPVDGLEMKSLGSTNQASRVTIINGRTTSSTSIAFQWAVTPTREGTFTIPPVKVSADGMTSITKAIRLTVTKADAGDLVFAEIERNLDQVFTGQPLELTLKVYVKAYQDEENGISIGASSMWAMLAENSQWGVFQETLENLRMNRMQPRGIPVIRKDKDGNDAKYFLFEIDATYFPSRPGTVDVQDDVKIVMEYPLAIERSRAEDRLRSRFDSMFGNDFPLGGSLLDEAFFGGRRPTTRISKQMPIAIRPDMESVTAKAIPNEDQPDDFTGAVGRYVIETEVNNTSVQAGDPIELTIRVRGTGVMESVVAPPLSELPEVTDRFRVSTQSLAGQVAGDTKSFVTTIRPLDPSVTEIPAIPFSYFDPDSAEYETSYSDPIPIRVSPADVLDLAIGKVSESSVQKQDESKSAEATSPASGDWSWQPITDGDSTHQRWLTAAYAGLAIPPAIFLVCGLGRMATSVHRRRASESKTLAAIRSAKNGPSMMKEMNEFLAKKWNLTEHLPHQKHTMDQTHTMDQILGRLRSLGHHRYAVRVQQWSDSVQKHSETDQNELESLRQSAIEIVSDAKAQRKLPNKIIAAVLALASFALNAHTPAHANQDGATPTDSVVWFAEQAYNDGDFASAVTALQTQIDGHAVHPKLYVNLANTHRQLGNLAKAKANYFSALQLDFNDTVARRNLLSLENPGSVLTTVIELPTQPLVVLAIMGWFTLWIALTVRLWTAAFAWKTFAVSGFFVALIASVLVGLQIHALWRPQHAVIVADELPLRRGDGESFDAVATVSDASGQVVRWISKRPGWVQIETNREVQGWVPSESLEMIRTVSKPATNSPG